MVFVVVVAGTVVVGTVKMGTVVGWVVGCTTVVVGCTVVG
jgi:hypothetical protein